MKDYKVGIMGAGVMGAGIALALARGQFSVVLVDAEEKCLEVAMVRIRNEMKLTRLFKDNKSNEEHGNAEMLARIHPQVGLLGFDSLEFVIECVPELLPIKMDVYRSLSATCNPQCIIASNTSAIPITQIAAMTSVPENVVGIHFMNPVTMGDYVELIRGHRSSQHALGTAREVLTKMGKKWVEINDGPGFVTNRVLMLTINEAIYVLQEGVGSAAEIDMLFRSCFGHKMGPLETADLIGLDTILNSIVILYDSFNDSKYRPCPLLKQMVHANMLGRKSGRGFYTY